MGDRRQSVPAGLSVCLENVHQASDLVSIGSPLALEDAVWLNLPPGNHMRQKKVLCVVYFFLS